jgi:hypothetical protein
MHIPRIVWLVFMPRWTSEVLISKAGVSSDSSFCYQARGLSGAYLLIFHGYRGQLGGASSFELICAK